MASTLTGVFIGAINRPGVESPWDILSNVRGVGSGVFECRIDFGPGYRLHFGQDGDTLIILLRGGISGRRHHFERTAT